MRNRALIGMGLWHFPGEYNFFNLPYKSIYDSDNNYWKGCQLQGGPSSWATRTSFIILDVLMVMDRGLEFGRIFHGVTCFLCSIIFAYSLLRIIGLHFYHILSLSLSLSLSFSFFLSLPFS